MMTWTVSDKLVLNNVQLTVPPSWVVAVDDEGWTTQDTSIAIQISPVTFVPILGYLLVNEYDLDDTGYENPTTVASISSSSPAESRVTIGRGFYFDTTKKYACIARVFDERGGMIESNKIPIDLVEFGFKKTDEMFPNVKLRWEDYYPSLGTRRLIVSARIRSDTAPAFNERYRINAQLDTSATEVGFLTGSEALEKTVEVQLGPDGVGILNLRGTGLAPSVTVGNMTYGYDDLKIVLKIYDGENNLVGEYSEILNIRNAFNTTLQEVLAGVAVFCEDTFLTAGGPQTFWNRVGISRADGVLKLDAVQKMLNNVVLRKKSVLASQEDQFPGTSYGMNLVDGKYDQETRRMVRTFLEEFNVNDIQSENIGKLINDYQLLQEHDASYWEGRIIDRYILVGNHFDLINDRKINPDPSVGDTGLYELDFAVNTLIEALIQTADRYRNEPVASRYIPRNGEPEVSRGPGLPYSYGAKDSIEEFLEWSRPVQAPADTEDVPDYYRGNLTEIFLENMGITPPEGLGPDKWTGLKKNELDIWLAWATHAPTPPQNNDHRFYPHHWSGIDCSGFVQRAYLSIMEFAVNNHDARKLRETFHDIQRIRVGGELFNSSDAFLDENRTEFRVSRFYDANAVEYRNIECMVGRGDLVAFPGHIAMVYRTEGPDRTGKCLFDIVHAYGGAYRGVPLSRFSRQIEFIKKVIVSDLEIVPNFTYIGRVVLWE